MASTTNWVLAVGLGGCLWLDAGRAAACGGGGVVAHDSEAAVVADAQRILLSLRFANTASVQTEIVAQLAVPQTSADYGVLIPTPVMPRLDAVPIASSDFDELDRRTQPTIVREYELPDPDSGGFSCGCGSMAGETKDTSAPGGVEASAPVEVGPVTAVVLQADDPAALTAWLAENGFAVPPDQEALVARYVRPGGAFIAVRRNEHAVTNAPSSIGLHYTLPGDYRVVSLAFARLGAAPQVSFTVFVSAPSAVRPSGAFVDLTLDDLDARLLESSYAEAVTAAVAAQRYAFVLESATPFGPVTANDPRGFSAFSPHFAQLFDTGTLTRASTIMAADTLDTDATFDAPADRHIPQSRTISAYPLTRGASIGTLSLLLVARAVRRRGARRAETRRT